MRAWPHFYFFRSIDCSVSSSCPHALVLIIVLCGVMAAAGVPACRSDVLGPAKEQVEVRGGYLWWRCYGALHPVLCCAVLSEEGRSQVRGGPVCPPTCGIFVWRRTRVVAQESGLNIFFFLFINCPA